MFHNHYRNQTVYSTTTGIHYVSYSTKVVLAFFCQGFLAA